MTGISQVRLAGSRPFHCAQKGTRTPPSHVVALNLRSGPFFEVVVHVGPPLSENNQTKLRFSCPS
jgi:hypothetical protein